MDLGLGTNSPQGGGHTSMSAEEMLTFHSLTQLRTAWEREHELVEQLSQELDAKEGDLSLEIARTQISLMNGTQGGGKNPYLVVKTTKQLLSSEISSSIHLWCCVRTGNSWTVIRDDDEYNEDSHIPARVDESSRRFDIIGEKLDITDEHDDVRKSGGRYINTPETRDNLGANMRTPSSKLDKSAKSLHDDAGLGIIKIKTFDDSVSQSTQGSSFVLSEMLTESELESIANQAVTGYTSDDEEDNSDPHIQGSGRWNSNNNKSNNSMKSFSTRNFPIGRNECIGITVYPRCVWLVWGDASNEVARAAVNEFFQLYTVLETASQLVMSSLANYLEHQQLMIDAMTGRLARELSTFLSTKDQLAKQTENYARDRNRGGDYINDEDMEEEDEDGNDVEDDSEGFETDSQDEADDSSKVSHASAAWREVPRFIESCIPGSTCDVYILCGAQLDDVSVSNSTRRGNTPYATTPLNGNDFRQGQTPSHPSRFMSPSPSSSSKAHGSGSILAISSQLELSNVSFKNFSSPSILASSVLQQHLTACHDMRNPHRHRVIDCGDDTFVKSIVAVPLWSHLQSNSQGTSKCPGGLVIRFKNRFPTSFDIQCIKAIADTVGPLLHDWMERNRMMAIMPVFTDAWARRHAFNRDKKKVRRARSNNDKGNISQLYSQETTMTTLSTLTLSLSKSGLEGLFEIDDCTRLLANSLDCEWALLLISPPPTSPSSSSSSLNAAHTSPPKSTPLSPLYSNGSENDQALVLFDNVGHRKSIQPTHLKGRLSRLLSQLLDASHANSTKMKRSDNSTPIHVSKRAETNIDGGGNINILNNVDLHASGLLKLLQLDASKAAALRDLPSQYCSVVGFRISDGGSGKIGAASSIAVVAGKYWYPVGKSDVKAVVTTLQSAVDSWSLTRELSLVHAMEQSLENEIVKMEKDKAVSDLLFKLEEALQSDCTIETFALTSQSPTTPTPEGLSLRQSFYLALHKCINHINYLTSTSNSPPDDSPVASTTPATTSDVATSSHVETKLLVVMEDKMWMFDVNVDDWVPVYQESPSSMPILLDSHTTSPNGTSTTTASITLYNEQAYPHVIDDENVASSAHSDTSSFRLLLSLTLVREGSTQGHPNASSESVTRVSIEDIVGLKGLSIDERISKCSSAFVARHALTLFDNAQYRHQSGSQSTTSIRASGGLPSLPSQSNSIKDEHVTEQALQMTLKAYDKAIHAGVQSSSLFAASKFFTDCLESIAPQFIVLPVSAFKKESNNQNTGETGTPFVSDRFAAVITAGDEDRGFLSSPIMLSHLPQRISEAVLQTADRNLQKVSSQVGGNTQGHNNSSSSSSSSLIILKGLGSALYNFLADQNMSGDSCQQSMALLYTCTYSSMHGKHMPKCVQYLALTKEDNIVTPSHLYRLHRQLDTLLMPLTMENVMQPLLTNASLLDKMVRVYLSACSSSASQSAGINPAIMKGSFALDLDSTFPKKEKSTIFMTDIEDDGVAVNENREVIEGQGFIESALNIVNDSVNEEGELRSGLSTCEIILRQFVTYASDIIGPVCSSSALFCLSEEDLQAIFENADSFTPPHIAASLKELSLVGIGSPGKILSPSKMASGVRMMVSGNKSVPLQSMREGSGNLDDGKNLQQDKESVFVTLEVLSSFEAQERIKGDYATTMRETVSFVPSTPSSAQSLSSVLPTASQNLSVVCVTIDLAVSSIQLRLPAPPLSSDMHQSKKTVTLACVMFWIRRDGIATSQMTAASTPAVTKATEQGLKRLGQVAGTLCASTLINTNKTCKVISGVKSQLVGEVSQNLAQKMAFGCIRDMMRYSVWNSNNNDINASENDLDNDHEVGFEGDDSKHTYANNKKRQGNDNGLGFGSGSALPRLGSSVAAIKRLGYVDASTVKTLEDVELAMARWTAFQREARATDASLGTANETLQRLLAEQQKTNEKLCSVLSSIKRVCGLSDIDDDNESVDSLHTIFTDAELDNLLFSIAMNTAVVEDAIDLLCSFGYHEELTLRIRQLVASLLEDASLHSLANQHTLPVIDMNSQSGCWSLKSKQLLAICKRERLSRDADIDDTIAVTWCLDHLLQNYQPADDMVSSALLTKGVRSWDMLLAALSSASPVVVDGVIDEAEVSPKGCMTHYLPITVLWNGNTTLVAAIVQYFSRNISSVQSSNSIDAAIHVNFRRLLASMGEKLLSRSEKIMKGESNGPTMDVWSSMEKIMSTSVAIIQGINVNANNAIESEYDPLYDNTSSAITLHSISDKSISSFTSPLAWLRGSLAKECGRFLSLATRADASLLLPYKDANDMLCFKGTTTVFIDEQTRHTVECQVSMEQVDFLAQAMTLCVGESIILPLPHSSTQSSSSPIYASSSPLSPLTPNTPMPFSPHVSTTHDERYILCLPFFVSSTGVITTPSLMVDSRERPTDPLSTAYLVAEWLVKPRASEAESAMKTVVDIISASHFRITEKLLVKSTLARMKQEQEQMRALQETLANKDLLLRINQAKAISDLETAITNALPTALSCGPASLVRATPVTLSAYRDSMQKRMSGMGLGLSASENGSSDSIFNSASIQPEGSEDDLIAQCLTTSTIVIRRPPLHNIHGQGMDVGSHASRDEHNGPIVYVPIAYMGLADQQGTETLTTSPSFSALQNNPANHGFPEESLSWALKVQLPSSTKIDVTGMSGNIPDIESKLISLAQEMRRWLQQHFHKVSLDMDSVNLRTVGTVCQQVSNGIKELRLRLDDGLISDWDSLAAAITHMFTCGGSQSSDNPQSNIITGARVHWLDTLSASSSITAISSSSSDMLWWTCDLALERQDALFNENINLDALLRFGAWRKRQSSASPRFLEQVLADGGVLKSTVVSLTGSALSYPILPPAALSQTGASQQPISVVVGDEALECNKARLSSDRVWLAAGSAVVELQIAPKVASNVDILSSEGTAAFSMLRQTLTATISSVSKSATDNTALALANYDSRLCARQFRILGKCIGELCNEGSGNHTIVSLSMSIQEQVAKLPGVHSVWLSCIDTTDGSILYQRLCTAERDFPLALNAIGPTGGTMNDGRSIAELDDEEIAGLIGMSGSNMSPSTSSAYRVDHDPYSPDGTPAHNRGRNSHHPPHTSHEQQQQQQHQQQHQQRQQQRSHFPGGRGTNVTWTIDPPTRPGTEFVMECLNIAGRIVIHHMTTNELCEAFGKVNRMLSQVGIHDVRPPLQSSSPLAARDRSSSPFTHPRLFSSPTGSPSMSSPPQEGHYTHPMNAMQGSNLLHTTTKTSTSQKMPHDTPSLLLLSLTSEEYQQREQRLIQSISRALARRIYELHKGAKNKRLMQETSSAVAYSKSRILDMERKIEELEQSKTALQLQLEYTTNQEVTAKKQLLETSESSMKAAEAHTRRLQEMEEKTASTIAELKADILRKEQLLQRTLMAVQQERLFGEERRDAVTKDLTRALQGEETAEAARKKVTEELVSLEKRSKRQVDMMENQIASLQAELTIMKERESVLMGPADSKMRSMMKKLAQTEEELLTARNTVKMLKSEVENLTHSLAQSITIGSITSRLGSSYTSLSPSDTTSTSYNTKDK